MTLHPSPTVETASADIPSARASRRRRRASARIPLTWLTAFVGFFLLCGGWALATPYDGAPDEMQHIIRAVGVVRGEIAPDPVAADMGTGAFQHVPASLLRQNCWMFWPEQSAACSVPPGGDQHLVKASTRAGRYHPLYYLFVGWPLALWPTMKGVLLARLVSAALSAAFLAAAAHAAVRWTRHRLMAAGVLAAVTPITVHLSGSVNPNGLEIAVGAALFAALIPTALELDTPVRRAAVVQIGVAGVTLASLRTLGPLWVFAIVAVLLVPARRARLRELVRYRPLRWAAAAIAASVAFGAIWSVVMRVGELGVIAPTKPLTVHQTLKFELMARLPGYLTEMVGIPSWLDTVLPNHFYEAWQLLLGALLVPAFVLGTWSDRWRMAAIAGGSIGVLILPETLSVNQNGFVSQGRYALPLMIGLPILAAWLLGRRGILAPAHGDRLTRFTAMAVAVLHLCFLAYTMVRWQSGVGKKIDWMPVNPFGGDWHPLVGSTIALGTGAIGCALLVAWAWGATRRPSGAAAAVPEETA